MGDLLLRVLPLAGLAVMVAVCLGLSTDRRAALRRWDLIAWGFGLQVLFALFILKTQAGQAVFQWLNDAVQALIGTAHEGAEFVFGALATGPGPGNVATVAYVDGEAPDNPGGFIMAFHVLTPIVFFSALAAVLYHLGVLQRIVFGVAWVMQRTMKTSGAETLSAAANIFVGMIEAPLMVRPYLAKLTRSELMTLMTVGFATVAGGMMAAYISIVGGQVEGIAGHVLAASIMSAPAALLFGKLMVPETETPETGGRLEVDYKPETANVLDAAAAGTMEGVRIVLNVAGMLIAFLALLALLDLILQGSSGLVLGQAPEWFTVRGLLGYLFAPLAFLMGVADWGEAVQVGQLLGVKMATNELVAYLDLIGMEELSDRSRLIAVYALCGFANFGSIGIQIGGLSALAPERRKDISILGLRAMLAGSFAANATACVAAILV